MGPTTPGRAGEIAASCSHLVPQPLMAPRTLLLASHHVTMSLHTHGHLFLAAARCQAWVGSTLCHVPHMPKGALGAWAGSKGTAGTQPWELPALAMRCWQPCATHPQARGGVARSPSGLWLLLGRGGSHGHRSAPCCAPWLWGGHEDTSGEAYGLPSSQHSASASPVSVAHGGPITGPRLWHISGQRGRKGIPAGRKAAGYLQGLGEDWSDPLAS